MKKNFFDIFIEAVSKIFLTTKNTKNSQSQQIIKNLIIRYLYSL